MAALPEHCGVVKGGNSELISEKEMENSSSCIRFSELYQQLQAERCSLTF